MRKNLTMLVSKYHKLAIVAGFSYWLGTVVTIIVMPWSVPYFAEPCSDSAQIEIAITDSSVEYAVLVVSAPKNQVKRDAVRSTWARLVNNVVVENGKTLVSWNQNKTLQSENRTKGNQFIKVVFVVGATTTEAEYHMLVAENNKHHDLVILNMIDVYDKLSLKLLNALHYFVKTFVNMKYLIKCDDDSFVRIDLLVKELEASAPYMNATESSQYITTQSKKTDYLGLYWGYFNGKARVFSQGKWQEQEWFLCDKYLPYALGGGYVLSNTIAAFIAVNMDYLSVYKSEDVSMGVWTAPFDKLNRVHDIRFDTEWTSRGCTNDMLIRHKQQPAAMLAMYKSLLTSQGTKLCPTEFSKRDSYFYNWEVPPSQCCTALKSMNLKNT